MVVPLSGLTYVFLSPEMFALYFLGITAIISITSENILKGLISAAFGLLIAMVGRDPLTAVSRYDFGIAELRGGIDTAAAVIGLLAVSELFRSMRQNFRWDALSTKFEAKFPPLGALWRVAPAVGIGTLIGSVIGAVPGVSGTASAVISYQQSKLWSRHPEEYGKGSVEGIAANESAQNASQAGEMVPTFGLGIPSGGAMVILLGALLIHGFVPGPMMIREAPELLHACVAGLLGATVALALIGWPIGKALVYLVRLDRTFVLVGALGLTMVGDLHDQPLGARGAAHARLRGRRLLHAPLRLFGRRRLAGRRPRRGHGAQPALRPAARGQQHRHLRQPAVDRGDPAARVRLPRLRNPVVDPECPTGRGGAARGDPRRPGEGRLRGLIRPEPPRQYISPSLRASGASGPSGSMTFSACEKTTQVSRVNPTGNSTSRGTERTPIASSIPQSASGVTIGSRQAGAGTPRRTRSP